MNAIVYGTPAPTRKQHVMHDGKFTWATEILRFDDLAKPYAFLVEQQPECIIRPHFHDTSQFQVAVDGSGTLNGHALLPYTVHYTARQTSYGPIIAGEKGLSYLTLRPARDLAGPMWMPDSISIAERKAKRRQVTSEPASADAMSGETLIELIPLDGSGLGSWIMHVEPGTISHVPGGENTDGRYCVILSGKAVYDGKALSRMSLFWVPPEVSEFDIEAGDEALDLLVMQFPFGSAARPERGDAGHA